MIILPAIDIMSGQPVRLYQGEYDQKTVVADSVIDTAKRFEAEGASWIHMVDLDGAKEGKRENAELIKQTAAAVSIPIEVGGGIRSIETVDDYLSAGIARVILGTAAIENQDLVKTAVKKYGEKIAVGIDCKNGKAAGSGWLTNSGIGYLELAATMESIGVQTIIVTDISKDGTLAGPNLEMLENLKRHTKMNIIASGGIANIENIKDLKALNLYGAITGKAIYTGSLSLPLAIQIGEGS